jgi:TolC family type I secretion outer membrane protein
LNFRKSLVYCTSIAALALVTGANLSKAQETEVKNFSTDQIIFLPNDTAGPNVQKEVEVYLSPEDLAAIEAAAGESIEDTMSEEQNELEHLSERNEITEVFEKNDSFETAPASSANPVANEEVNIDAIPPQQKAQIMEPILEGDPDAPVSEAKPAVSAAAFETAERQEILEETSETAIANAKSEFITNRSEPLAPINRQELFWKTLEQTFENNPILQRERENVRLAYEQVFEARTGWLPNISAEAGISGVYNDYDSRGSTDETIKSASLGVQQPIYRSGRVQHALKREEFNAQSAYFTYLDSVQSVLLSYITAYIDVVTAKSSLEFNKSNVERLQRQNEATQKEFDVGLLTLTDVSQAKARLSQARSDYIQAEGFLQQRLAIFTEITGLDLALNDFVFPDVNFDEVLSAPLPKTLRESQFIALENNPVRKASLLQIKAAQANIELNKSELYPEISLSGSVERQDDGALSSANGQSSAIIGLVASIPIYDAGLTKSRIRQSKIQKFSQYDNDLAVKRQVTQKVTSAYQDFLTAQAVIDSSEAQLEAAKTAREGVYSEREVGARTVLDALDADQELLNAQVQLVTARRNLLVGKFALLAAMGYLTPEVLPLESHFNDNLQQEFSTLGFKQLFSSDVQPMDNY